MVKQSETSEEDKLEEIVKSMCKKYGLKLYVEGWARKTYDIFEENRKSKRSEHLARIESLAAKSGEIRYFDNKMEDFATELGKAIESQLNVEEALLIRENRPGY